MDGARREQAEPESTPRGQRVARVTEGQLVRQSLGMWPGDPHLCWGSH